MSSVTGEVLLDQDYDENEDNLSWGEITIGDLSSVDSTVVELDKSPYLNLKEQAAILANIIPPFSEVEYPMNGLRRQRHEVNGGYKIARRRGARLNEVGLYNLLFRFADPLRRNAIAIMTKTEQPPKEKILLLPDDTLERCETESSSYLTAARRLVMQGKMDSDDQSNLIENLRFLNVHERCAQTLQHEFGHILHWRIWDELGVGNFKEQLNWFVINDYYDLTCTRIPGFKDLHVLEKIHILKESLVEDYRISLNLQAENGKFILPNKYCYSGDFECPDLMYEGVETMKNMLDEQSHGAPSRTASSSDYDSLKAFDMVQSLRRRNPNWVAGERFSTKETIEKDLEQLDQELEVASTIEEGITPIK